MSQTINFYKYQGAGNDFILLDHRNALPEVLEEVETIAYLCDRRFGIGADGLIRLTQQDDAYDFEMHYYNADGRLGSMCGNGGRCVVAFAHDLGMIKESATFLAVDGPHQAKVTQANWVELGMNDVQEIRKGDDYYFLDTGSPHHVSFVEQLDQYEVFEKGKAIRYGEPYGQEGTNVNFVQAVPHGLAVRTYERGVEDETLACGTGVTAAAMAYAFQNQLTGAQSIPIQAQGGQLEIRFDRVSDAHFRDVWLCGPAKFVFKGTIELP